MPVSQDLPAYSVLQTVYEGDTPEEFEAALDSVLNQTLPPSEVLVVADGPLTDGLESVINEARSSNPKRIRLHRLDENRGHGAAAKVGVMECTHEIIGIMSADDICVPDRFEKQLTFLTKHPDVDVVGGYISEFVEDPNTPSAIRRVPTEPEAIASTAKVRSPMNEVTVTFRRETVLSAGNYREVDRMDDYDLWVRLLTDGATLANLNTVLVKARGGKDMFARRGGLEYAREEIRQQRALLDMDFIGLPRFILNLAIRVPVRLLPNRLRSLMYRKFLREEIPQR